MKADDRFDRPPLFLGDKNPNRRPARYAYTMKSPATLSRVTISLPADLAQTLLSLRLTHAVSVSAIAETAIRQFLETHPPEDLRSRLKASGAGLRRRSFEANVDA